MGADSISADGSDSPSDPGRDVALVGRERSACFSNRRMMSWWRRSRRARERAAANDPRLKGASRFEEGGWIYVHLEGDPGAVGYQHGYLLAREIEDGFAAVSAGMMHGTERDWEFFRKAAHEMLWPKIDAEYQQELQGIVDGLRARTGSKLDVDDLVAFIYAFEELPDYYVAVAEQAAKSGECRRT